MCLNRQASKQAILIIAHEVNSVFTTLLQMLDHPKIDIFIHMDAKTKAYDPSNTLKLVNRSRIFHTPRIKVFWGGYSQIEAELLLLDAAASQGHYEHYHLLSGADLPIKKTDEIIDFFERHHGQEFVNFQSANFGYPERVMYYYPLQDVFSRQKNKVLRKINALVRRVILFSQKIMHVHRNKGINFQKGTQWFSITDSLARYVLSKQEWIRNVFHDTFCCDEVFLHTLVENSRFKDNLYNPAHDDRHVASCMRLIDWKRGSPYTFRLSDLDEIISSPAMFARKFHPSVDAEIIDRIRELYS